METKIKLKQAVDSTKTIRVEERAFTYVNEGILIIEPELGVETLIPWGNVGWVRTTGITQTDLEEVRANAAAARQQDEPVQQELELPTPEPEPKRRGLLGRR